MSGDLSCLGSGLTLVSQRGRANKQPTRSKNQSLPQPQWTILMGGLAALCLLLMFPVSSSQNPFQLEQELSVHQGPAAPPPNVRELLIRDDSPHLNAQQTYAQDDKDNAKIFLFIAASVGTFALMVAVYCIYNKFYTKQQYLHAQLNDDPDSDTLDPPVFFHASADSSAACLQKSGYGSLSDTPSIISVPPSLSPHPSAMPFPPLFLSSRSLRTISAQDLEKNCI
ncbi:uncharacterized protein LOC106530700 [Austrofundulus limnaeus]|uniref:Uncharacterized protein LOC106530700 n=1 Tax=Austrofundulus limnaeus TaxID=52670 RepID=A0A2I4CPC7_AUSLI|nr:PREDICTED: uncharacterized protein LOC106530700 [Austrofundulus limnaeus]